MGMEWGLETLKIPYSAQILSCTMYGASTLPALSFQIGTALHILVATVVWVMIYSLLSADVLKKKDV